MKSFLLPTLCFCALCINCTTHNEPTSREEFCVTILPLRSLVEQITEEDFPVDVLVPPGASPETFEPTPKQIARLRNSRLIFSVGLLDFERTMLAKSADSSRLIDLSRGIDLITGSCTHDDKYHPHGIDPHVWLSPRELRIMAANAYAAIHDLYPDSTRYTANYQQLDTTLTRLDSTLAAEIARSGVRSLLIYHPALTYYARAYSLEQIAIEAEGKEPSARRLAELIRRAREEQIHSVFHQSQFPASTVETISRDIAGRPVSFDPLAEEVIENLKQITKQLIQSKQ